MQIDNFRIIDSNNELVQIELEYPLDFKTVIDTSSYILNNEDEYFRNSINATDEDIDMIHRAISRKINLDLMKKKECVDPDVANKLSDLKDIRVQDEKNLYDQKIVNSLTGINGLSAAPNINEPTTKRTSIFNNPEGLKSSDLIKEEIEQRERQKRVDSLRDLMGWDKRSEETEEDSNNTYDLDLIAKENSFNSIIQKLKDNGYRNVYISGPVRGIGYDVAKRSFRAFAAILEKEDIIADHTFANMYPNNRTKEYYIKNGITRMMQCDAVLRFNTQIISEGADVEKKVANAIGMPYFETNIACVIM